MMWTELKERNKKENFDLKQKIREMKHLLAELCEEIEYDNYDSQKRYRDEEEEREYRRRY